MLTIQQLHMPNECYDKHATIYRDQDIRPRACIFYFHGGGLLYGMRTDLPSKHIELLTKAGYIIVAFDYPLAPAAKLDQIFADVCGSVNTFAKNMESYLGCHLPYILWGRSAGAYLSLLAAAKGKLEQKPAGILSYYGYGFLCDHWFETPSQHYCSLPAVDASCMEACGGRIHAEGSLDTHYMFYVYARQTGTWKELIYEGRDKFFYLNHTLRTCDRLPCPLFCAHSTDDPDVPYAEFLELCSRFSPTRFIAASEEHDFDRDEDSPVTATLLEKTLAFLDHIVPLSV